MNKMSCHIKYPSHPKYCLYWNSNLLILQGLKEKVNLNCLWFRSRFLSVVGLLRYGTLALSVDLMPEHFLNGLDI